MNPTSIDLSTPRLKNGRLDFPFEELEADQIWIQEKRAILIPLQLRVRIRRIVYQKKRPDHIVEL
jgi:hypothetical protein